MKNHKKIYIEIDREIDEFYVTYIPIMWEKHLNVDSINIDEFWDGFDIIIDAANKASEIFDKLKTIDEVHFITSFAGRSATLFMNMIDACKEFNIKNKKVYIYQSKHDFDYTLFIKNEYFEWLINNNEVYTLEHESLKRWI